MMYYNTPKVEKYLEYIQKNRVYIIVLFIVIISILLAFHRPTLLANDDSFWINESTELQRTLSKDYETSYIKKLEIDITGFDNEMKKKLQTLHNDLINTEKVHYIDSLFSANYIYHDNKYEDSSLVKSISVDEFTAVTLKKFVNKFYYPYTKYVDKEFTTLTMYLYTDESFTMKSLDIPFIYRFDEKEKKYNLQTYIMLIIFTVIFTVLFFYIIFKNYISGILALVITGSTLIISYSLMQVISKTSELHVATALIIVSIALIDYLYFYYRWHVSHYNMDVMKSDAQAMIKTLSRNLMPAMWTTIITIVGFGSLVIVDSLVVKMLAISAIGASLITYILNITLLPALLSYFYIEKHKVIFSKIAYNFANGEIHYNKWYLKIFLTITTVLLLGGSYNLFFATQKLFSESIDNKVISIKVAYPEVDYKLFKSLESFEYEIKENFEGISSLDSVVSILKLINIKEKNSEIDEESFLEALFFLELYDLEKNYITDESINIRINVGNADRSELINWITEYKKLDLYFTDMETIVKRSKTSSLSILSFSLAGALIIIGLIMGRIFREYKMILVAFMVNAIPIVWFMFFIQLFSIPLTLEMLIAMTITVSLGSDATVHFAYKYSRSRYQGRTKKRSLEIMFFYGAIPVAIGSLLLLFLFLLLTQIDIPTLNQIGWYGIIMMILSVITDLFILPVLLVEEDTFKSNKKN
jgi:predicted RND superfamily exporter protein